MQRMIRLSMHKLLEELALLPFESSFLVRAERCGDALRLVDFVLASPGSVHNVPPSLTHPDAPEVRRESEERGYLLFEGHTHPVPEGETIPAYCCGWTAPRTAALRDLRDERLAAAPGGGSILRERRALQERLREPEADREGLLTRLIEHAPEHGHCNLIRINGFSAYISNRPNLRNDEELTQDINTRAGDFDRQHLLESFGRHGQALVHADPRYFGTPSSPDKYVMSVLRANGPRPDDAQPLRIL